MTYSGISASSMKLLIYFAIVFLLSVIPETKSKLDYKTRLQRAQAHYDRVIFKIACGTPQPTIIRMENPEMKLVPSATILYRCGNNTGCCDTPTQQCVAKTIKKVKLYFFANSFRGKKWKRTRRHKIKKFVFDNHTECHCVDEISKPR